ncbi:SHOCT domain-containing protein [Patescibacteria group bacterium]|nr:SHOCT domain-containing protein [Patescibacteria group bacterium]
MFWGHPHMYVWGRTGGFFFPSLLSILFFVIFIVLVWSLFTHRSDKRDTESNEDEMINEDTALEILKKRYAKGELTKRQFQEMKKDIG